ncbi:MAG TPA: zinc-binding dehydrogenase [Chloroflexota bacterium]|nr:zinc-binding dehydrogenase [Chloroflexota bacterium]
MRALVKLASGPGHLELRDLPDPQPRAGEVMVQVSATGICGSDLHIQDGEYQVEPPVVIGHETAGVVVATGPGVTACRVGDRVTSKTTISTCGACDLCRAGRTNLCPQRRWLGGHVNGGFAPYLVVPEANILPLPDPVSLDAAALTEPLACCVHGVLELARPAPGSYAVISGPGPIGLLCAQVARAAGATVVILGTSADEARFALARRLGFQHLVDVQTHDPLEEVSQLSGGRGPDLCVEAAGAAASLEGCLRLAPRGGTVLQIGLYGKPVTVPLDTLVLKEIRLLGSFSSTPTAWPTALELLAGGQVQAEALVTSKRPLEEWEAAFQAAREKGEGKILLTP